MSTGNAAIHFIDRHISEGRASKTAFIDTRGEHTYTNLALMVSKAGHALFSLGVKRGDRVILCLNDSVSFPALFFGALKIGAIPVPINTSHRIGVSCIRIKFSIQSLHHFIISFVIS